MKEESGVVEKGIMGDDGGEERWLMIVCVNRLLLRITTARNGMS